MRTLVIKIHRDIERQKCIELIFHVPVKIGDFILVFASINHQRYRIPHFCKIHFIK